MHKQATNQTKILYYVASSIYDMYLMCRVIRLDVRLCLRYDCHTNHRKKRGGDMLQKLWQGNSKCGWYSNPRPRSAAVRILFKSHFRGRCWISPRTHPYYLHLTSALSHSHEINSTLIRAGICFVCFVDCARIYFNYKKKFFQTRGTIYIRTMRNIYSKYILRVFYKKLR